MGRSGPAGEFPGCVASPPSGDRSGIGPGIGIGPGMAAGGRCRLRDRGRSPVRARSRRVGPGARGAPSGGHGARCVSGAGTAGDPGTEPPRRRGAGALPGLCRARENVAAVFSGCPRCPGSQSSRRSVPPCARPRAAPRAHRARLCLQQFLPFVPLELREFQTAASSLPPIRCSSSDSCQVRSDPLLPLPQFPHISHSPMAKLVFQNPVKIVNLDFQSGKVLPGMEMAKKRGNRNAKTRRCRVSESRGSLGMSKVCFIVMPEASAAGQCHPYFPQEPHRAPGCCQNWIFGARSPHSFKRLHPGHFLQGSSNCT